MSDEIIVEVATDGKTTISVRGHKGSGCKALTRELEKALGKVQSDSATNEMYERPERQVIRQ